jgi:hypothetical protein
MTPQEEAEDMKNVGRAYMEKIEENADALRKLGIDTGYLNCPTEIFNDMMDALEERQPSTPSPDTVATPEDVEKVPRIGKPEKILRLLAEIFATEARVARGEIPPLPKHLTHNPEKVCQILKNAADDVHRIQAELDEALGWCADANATVSRLQKELLALSNKEGK